MCAAAVTWCLSETIAWKITPDESGKFDAIVVISVRIKLG